MRSLSVLWLHTPEKTDGKILPVVEYALSDAFRDFCHDAFNVGVPMEYPPLKLRMASSPEALPESLFIGGKARNGLTANGDDICLFLVDDNLYSRQVEGMELKQWLRLYIPAVPKIVLVYPGRRNVTVPQRRWAKKEASLFFGENQSHERIVHLFKSFWLPRFWDALKQYVAVKAGVAWHTPGHSGGNAFAFSPFLHGFHEAFGSMIFRSDLSVSVERLGDLSSPEAHTPLSEAQKLSSEIFGTALSAYITNGTSTSNKAMLMTLLKPGEEVLVDRNCHKSVHHAIVMSGAVPRYLPSRWNATLGVWGPVSLQDIAKSLEEAGTPPRLLILTTCTYEGVLYPVWEIAKLCEKRGTLFYADEAWAGYLNFHPFYTRETEDGAFRRYNAVNEMSGAHFAVQSTHKTMAAFSQASMIHVSVRFKALLEEDASPQYRWLRRRFALHGHGSYEKFVHDLREFLRYWHSTSPNYPFLATLDIAGVQMRIEGMKLLDERLKWVNNFKQRVAAECSLRIDECFADLQAIAGDSCDWARCGYLLDPMKITLMLKNATACRAFKKALLKSHIQWEKATSSTVMFLVTTGTMEEHFEDLFRVCRLNKELIGKPAIDYADREMEEAVSGSPIVLPHDAALCDGELVSIDESVGRIASQFLCPYPPGIPVFIPGLRITKEMVRLIKDVIRNEGAGAVHGLFCRGNHAPYLVEVLNRDEERRITGSGKR